MSYGWIIDKDHLSGPHGQYADDTLDRAGTMGPRDIPEELQRRLAAGEGIQYRMFDSDGELYYSGRLVRSEGEAINLKASSYFEGYLVLADGADEEWFGPLWDFGEPDSGATTIKYKDERNRWGVL